MITTLHQLKHLNLSNKFKKFWNTKIYNIEFKKSYSYHDKSNVDPFNSYLDKNLYFIIKLISDIKNFESYGYSEKINPSRLNLYNEFIENLYLEKIDILEAFENSPLQPIQNQYDLNNISIYEINNSILFCKTFLDIKNKYTNKINYITPKLFSFFVEQFKTSTFNDINSNIELYFKILDIYGQNNINKSDFINNLEVFSTTKDQHGDINNTIHLLNYSSQKYIFNFIENNFPQELENYSKYYKDLINTNMFSQEDTFQSSLSINLIKLYDYKKIPKDKEGSITSILKSAFLIITDQHYLEKLEKQISVFNTDVRENPSTITFLFSSKSEDELSQFKNILLNSIRGLINIIEQVEYNCIGFDDIITNLTPDLILKNYIFEDLKEQLSKHKSNKNKVKI